MEKIWGRKVLKSEVGDAKDCYDTASKMPTFKKLTKDSFQCLRCGTCHERKQVSLPSNDVYCTECIQLGRVDSSHSFYHSAEPLSKERKITFNWKGQLTKGQEKISAEIKKAIKENSIHLVWAVTGAGKTEMLFESIYFALSKGYRIGIASPRVDVCIELFPRIQHVFPKESIALLHGKQKEAYHYTKLVICTTHQLLRFYQAFDVLIIDEIDAFPFANTPSLHFGVTQALKTKHTCIYLTATPTKELKKQIQKKELTLSLLPARYHRRKLPVPKIMWQFNWYQKIKKERYPKKLIKTLETLLLKNNVLIFCPTIALLPHLKKVIEKFLPLCKVTTVHSQDSERLEKVQKMREKIYDIFLTTTILERGVTFDRISVVVLGANHSVYTESTLVQISGRVDRKKKYTAGEILFFHDGYSSAMKGAIRQIKYMNKLAKEWEMIDEV